MPNKDLKLADSIWNLEKLKYLKLSQNIFIELPENIGNLRELGKLYLEENKLPESITKVKISNRWYSS